MRITESSMNTKHQLALVENFMKICGQDVNTIPTFQSTKITDFRTRLIDEEIYGPKELVDSINHDNQNGILDGLCDILYVAYGAIATFGVTMDEYPIFSRTEGTGKLLYKHTAHNLIRNLDNAFQQYKRGVEIGDMITIGRGLTGVILEVNRFAEASNLDLASAFDEVHKSNMSKICITEQQALDSISMRIQTNPHKYVDYVDAIAAKVVVDDKEWFVIRRSLDNKVLKGNAFFEPDLDQFA